MSKTNYTCVADADWTTWKYGILGAILIRLEVQIAIQELGSWGVQLNLDQRVTKRQDEAVYSAGEGTCIRHTRSRGELEASLLRAAPSCGYDFRLI